MKYDFLPATGALLEATSLSRNGSRAEARPTIDLERIVIPSEVIELVPESVAREHRVIPVEFDGETVTVVAWDVHDIALADKLRFVLAKNVELVYGSREQIQAAIDRHYGKTETYSVDSLLQEFTETAIDFDSLESNEPIQMTAARTRGRLPQKMLFSAGTIPPRAVSEPCLKFAGEVRTPGEDNTYPIDRREGVFYYTVEEGQRVIVSRRDGTMEVIVGPRRVWKGFNTFRGMRHFVAHPGEYLMARYRDGRQEHLPGPVEIWMDPRQHLDITREDALQLAAKEAVVVYTRPTGSHELSRRIVHGPAMFVPEPGEWLHTFSWHASDGGSRGAQKVPKALMFQKLWLMPDQMYHDVSDVRTADDALLTIKLMIFFELQDIERMLDTTHDPIGDFVNAATSDVVDFTGRHDFESFKHNTDKLNELDTYRQLTGRAAQCGYRINKVVYRGYGAADSLQQMHNQAIEARTRLQLEKATERQSQELENYKLDCQLDRAAKRRAEQTAEVEQDILLQNKRQESELGQHEARLGVQREQRRLEEEMRLGISREQNAEQQRHLASLKNMGVDLTSFLTQARADRVIELRGAGAAHVHVDSATNGDHKGNGTGQP